MKTLVIITVLVLSACAPSQPRILTPRGGETTAPYGYVIHCQDAKGTPEAQHDCQEPK